MLLIPCPYCGARPEIEFTYAGQAHVARPSGAGISAQAWADFLYFRSNVKGVRAERWRHLYGCGQFFNALRDTRSDQFIATYRRDEPPPSAARDCPGGP